MSRRGATPLLFNPGAGRGRLQTTLERIAAGRPVELTPTASKEDAVATVRQLVSAGHSKIIAAGGDGTLHHVIRGLAGSECALGIVPAGTGNDFAGALGLPVDPLAALELALGGSVRSVDLGSAAGIPFAGVAGLGIVGEVIDYLHARPRRWRGAWVYPWALLRTLSRFRPPVVTLDSADEHYAGEAMIAALANSPRFGGGMRIAPAAELDDGWLRLVIVDRRPIPQLLALLPKIYSGRHVDHPAVRTARVRAVTLACDPPMGIFADGEPLLLPGSEGIPIEARPAALRVVL